MDVMAKSADEVIIQYPGVLKALLLPGCFTPCLIAHVLGVTREVFAGCARGFV
jgi:hypothetical protein